MYCEKCNLLINLISVLAKVKSLNLYTCLLAGQQFASLVFSQVLRECLREKTFQRQGSLSLNTSDATPSNIPVTKMDFSEYSSFCSAKQLSND